MIARIVAVCAAVLLCASPAFAEDAPDADLIFAHARTLFRFYSYPPSLAFAFQQSFTIDTRTYTKTYDGTLVDGKTLELRKFSREEMANPFVIKGFGFSFMGLPVGAHDRGDPEPFVKLALAPNESYGLAPFEAKNPALAALPSQSDSPSDSPSGLREIGRVRSVVKDYDVRYVGAETVDTHRVYHLALAPLHDPERLRLRDLWVDTSLYTVVKASVLGAVPDGPASKVPWTVKFAQYDGGWYISSERADVPIVVSKKVTLMNVSFRFIEMQAKNKTSLYLGNFGRTSPIDQPTPLPAPSP